MKINAIVSVDELILAEYHGALYASSMPQGDEGAKSGYSAVW